MTSEEYSKLIAIAKTEFNQHIERSKNEQSFMDRLFLSCFAIAIVCNAYVLASVLFSI